MYNFRGVFLLIIKIFKYKNMQIPNMNNGQLFKNLNFNIKSNKLISYGDLIENDKGVIYLQIETKIKNIAPLW